MKFVLFIFVLMTAISVEGQGLSCPVKYGYQSSYNFGKTIASVRIGRFSDLSPVVVRRIEDQLRKRVGNEFLKRAKFDYGEAFDLDESGELQPRDADRIDGYDMVFKFSDRSKGLAAFYFKVVADKAGTLVDGTLPLPDIAANSGLGKLVSCKQALDIARRNGFPPERSSIIFVYDWDAGIFTWKVSDSMKVEPDEPLFITGKGTYRTILIEAHTGRVMKIYKETIGL